MYRQYKYRVTQHLFPTAMYTANFVWCYKSVWFNYNSFEHSRPLSHTKKDQLK
ncbi:hypothetical protein C7972_108203 [Arenibacter sp. ARW7G5Y1]|nr:hypothetical protein C7972_108203 [Arenibacter sp. ARW7G5Y1]